MADTISDKVRSRPIAISLSPLQKASSRLTLVLWPAITIERLTTGDFITPSVFRVNASELRGGLIERPGDCARSSAAMQIASATEAVLAPSPARSFTLRRLKRSPTRTHSQRKVGIKMWSQGGKRRRFRAFKNLRKTTHLHS